MSLVLPFHKRAITSLRNFLSNKFYLMRHLSRNFNSDETINSNQYPATAINTTHNTITKTIAMQSIFTNTQNKQSGLLTKVLSTIQSIKMTRSMRVKILMSSLVVFAMSFISVNKVAAQFPQNFDAVVAPEAVITEATEVRPATVV